MLILNLIYSFPDTEGFLSMDWARSWSLGSSSAVSAVLFTRIGYNFYFVPEYEDIVGLSCFEMSSGILYIRTM